MNYKLLFLILFTLEHVYQLVLNLVQARSANNPTPANVADVYDAETYQKWRAYHGEKSKLTIWRTIASWALTMVLLACSSEKPTLSGTETFSLQVRPLSSERTA